MIAIIDYGVGNLFSLTQSLCAIGQDVCVTADAEEIAKADRIILPGVGAFADAIAKLKETKLDKVVLAEAKKGKPLMGICLGMQLLFEKSLEFGEYEGLGLIEGQVVPMQGAIPSALKIPHIGWNALQFTDQDHPLLSATQEGDCVYFVHSYFATDCQESVVATTEYGNDLTAMVARGNVMGCQFHPEKSGTVGLAILRAFCEEDFS